MRPLESWNRSGRGKRGDGVAMNGVGEPAPLITRGGPGAPEPRLPKQESVIENGPPSRAVHPFLRLIRAGNAAVSFLGTAVGGLAAAGAGVGLGRSAALALGLAAASTACVTAGGNVLNDILDRETDRQNHPDRPLVTGAISVGTARALAAGLFVASAVVIAPVLASAWLLAPLWALAVASLLLYEFLAKSRGLIGNLLVAVLTGAVFLYGGAAVGAVTVVAPLAAMALMATLSREIIKDMEDAEGDVDRDTLPRSYGIPAASLSARLAVAAAIVLSPLPILLGLAGSGLVEATYLAVVAAADLVFLLSVLRLPQQLHRAQTLSKGAMTVALVAFLATAFR